MSSIEVHYFAILKERAGVEVERVEFENMSYAELYSRLSQKHLFGLPAEMIQVAVNDEFSSMGDKVLPGAKVVFIPPVAGG